jgi:hypothetical protein
LTPQTPKEKSGKAKIKLVWPKDLSLINLRFEHLSTPMSYDRRGEGGPFLFQRVHDSRRYNSTLLSGASSDTAAKEILILCQNREIE